MLHQLDSQKHHLIEKPHRHLRARTSHGLRDLESGRLLRNRFRQKLALLGSPDSKDA